MNDLQPKSFKVTIKGQEFDCSPLRLSHRLILGRVQPLFNAAQDIAEGKKVELSSEEMIALEKDLDTLIGSLIPALNGVTLDILDIVDLISQMMNSMLPEDSKELKEAKVEVNKDLKAPETIGKS